MLLLLSKPLGQISPTDFLFYLCISVRFYLIAQLVCERQIAFYGRPQPPSSLDSCNVLYCTQALFPCYMNLDILLSHL